MNILNGLVSILSRLINNILNEEFEKSTNHLIIKEISKMSLDYVPESLLCREKELSSLVYFFKDVLTSFNTDTYQSTMIVVSGEDKSGKTVTLKRFGIDLEKFVRSKHFGSKIEFYYRHVNCIRYRTFYSIFINVIQSFVPEFPIRGFSTFELIKYLKEYLEISNSYLLLTLDDVNALVDDKDYESVLISLMATEIGSISIFKNRISIILINKKLLSNDPINMFISAEWKQNVVIFNEYTDIQLKQILEQRATETLYSGSWKNEDIKEIINIIHSHNFNSNDLRLGLEILWRSARESEKTGKATIDLKNNDYIELGMFEHSKIELNLKIQEKVILFIIAEIFITNPNLMFTKIKEIKKVFDQRKPELDIPFSTLGYTSIFNYLQELKKLNLIVAQVTNSQKRGRSTLIRLNIQPSHVSMLLKNQLLKN